MQKKVLVSGCFDLLHSGHIAFLKSAATYGDLYVCIGSDKTVYDLKGRYPVITQDERKVNEDGNTPNKIELCKTKNIELIVLDRVPSEGLPARSTTSLRTNSIIPFRIDLAGGWLDQPYVNKLHAGPVITISIEPTIEFNNRSGMASSTRNKAIELWKAQLPEGDPILLSKILFSYENPPGTKNVAGSQDSLGIVMPCLNYHHYTNDNYWPSEIISIDDESILSWLENHIYLIPLDPRSNSYDVLANTNISKEAAKNLADATIQCWEAILNKDLHAFGTAFLASFHAQIEMFPNMFDETIKPIIDKYASKSIGYKLSGAGGGGYLILIAEKEIENAIQIKIRRKNLM
jgi:cytidyltransferase-like protein